MIRWISDKLGTAPAFDPALTNDVVVLDVRDLVDKQGNSPAHTREKIDRGVALLGEGKKVVVCCDYGISRSNAIAAGILARSAGMSLSAAVKHVVRSTGEQEIKLAPLSAVRLALQEERGERQDDAEPRVLLTGGSGFIGARLARVLAGEVYVMAPSRADVNLAAGALDLDLVVKEHGINCIVHLANPRVYTSIGAIGETLTMLRNVLEVCKENGIRLIFPSQWEVYSGYRAQEIIADENLPLYPKGPYGEAKLLCETLIAQHRMVHGLQCALLRSTPLYGEGGDRPKFIYNFVRKAIRNETISTHRYLNGYPKLDLMHVDDFVSAVVSAIKTNYTGDVNLGAGVAISTRDVAEWIVRRLDSRSRVESRDIQDYAANVTMDITSAQRALSWQPSRSWEEGLAQLLEYVIQH